MDRTTEQRYLGVRYVPGAAPRGHVESYFIKLNDPHRRRALWLKATIYATRRAPQRAVAETWAIAFDGESDARHVAVKSTIAYEDARFSRDGLDVDVAGVSLRPDATRGAIESGGRTIAWDLALTNDAAPLVHFPAAWMYERALPSSKLVSPFPDLRARGTVVVNGEAWSIDGWRGLLGHNWGPRHAPLYAWGHCNVWDDGSERAEDAVIFEGVSGRTPIGPILSPITTLLCLRFRGVRYDLNAPRALLTSRASISPRRWTFAGGDDIVRIDGEMWGETDDFVGLFYANPDSTMTHCLNTKLAHARIDVTVRGRPTFTLRSRAAALEIGTMSADHGVRMYV